MSDVVDTWHDADPGRAPLLVLEPLGRMLDAAGIGSGRIHAERVGDGISNITFRITRDGADVILRRPPRPPSPAGLHDVLREGRYIEAAGLAGVPAPRILLTVRDESVLGVPFLVMERVDGVVITDELPPWLRADGDARAIAAELVSALAGVHLADWSSGPLGADARKGDFLSRQLTGYWRIWQRDRTRDVPDIDAVGDWLGKTLPEPGPQAIVHGDYRIGNIMFARTRPPCVLAVLDWELANIGDPLLDFGYFIATYPRGRQDRFGMLDTMSSVVSAAGFPERAELVAMYEEQTRRPAEKHIPWYVAFALWRTAVGLETIYRRTLVGTAEHPQQRALKSEVPLLAARAADIMRGLNPLRAGDDGWLPDGWRVPG